MGLWVVDCLVRGLLLLVGWVVLVLVKGEGGAEGAVSGL